MVSLFAVRMGHQQRLTSPPCQAHWSASLGLAHQGSNDPIPGSRQIFPNINVRAGMTQMRRGRTAR